MLVYTKIMQGLTDRQQALLTFVSAILIAVAGVSIPLGSPYWVALILALAGAVGFALKESFGSAPPAKA